MCIGFSSLLYSALCTFSSLFLLPYLFSTYFFILFLRLCFFVILRTQTLLAAVIVTETSCALFSFSYSCHGHASVADTIFSLTVLFGIRQSSRAFLSSSISSPRVRSTFSSLFLPFYCSLYMFSSVLIEKNHTETSCMLFPFFEFLSQSRFSGGHNFLSHCVIRHSSVVTSIFVVINIIITNSSTQQHRVQELFTRLRSIPTIFFASKRTVYI